ncbi:MAG: hypothetical protein O6826_08685 [Acidobacteria bacterium]|nr:hypothetical protein [Acidobacteriota bacterium]
MRLLIAIGLLLCQLSLGIIWFLRPVQRSTFEQSVPQDILGLIVITHPPSNLDFLEHTRLRNWFDLASENIGGRIPEGVREQVVSLFTDDVESLWFFIHHLDRQANGSWRIHFTAFLKPRPLHGRALELRIELAVKNTFGAAQTNVLDYQNIRVYTGSESGQILYQVQMPDFLLISNSEEGWQKTLRTTVGTEASLAESGSFRRIRSHLRINAGLFLYFKANRLFPLLPEFGYLIRWQKGEFSEDYYQIR